ncbi:MAG: OsmC family protein [Saprospiraceae bacterium]|nr:OsmC family protein [Saprospiraceae bacterium]
MTATITYVGNLRTEATHVLSGTTVLTDAPPDNQGLGAAFSPTDSTATSLGTCMLTTMGISARNHGINMDGAHAEVTKVMAANPRRIAKITVKITMPAGPFSELDQKKLEAAAHGCPVALSLHPDLEQDVQFVWPS